MTTQTETATGAAELRPCPFCNAERKYVRLQRRRGVVGAIWNTDCTRCEATGPSAMSDDDAIVKWNNLVADARVSALVAERDHLQSALKESIRLQGEYASEVERLKGALERPSNARFLKAPEPVARPDDEWCRRYAEWHEERYGE